MTPSAHTALRLLLALAAIVLSPAAASAQFASNIKLDKSLYLALEPLTATVTVMNRSGGDVVMGGRGGSNWLGFSISDSAGRQLTPVKTADEQPFIFKAGSTISREVRISKSFPIAEPGTYTISATIYDPGGQQHFASNRITFTVTDAKPYWEEPVGVPAGYPAAGRIHRYGLIIFRDLDKTSLYLRLSDEATRSAMFSAHLSPITSGIEPQQRIDSGNKLHVFFLAKPKVFGYVVVKPDGTLAKREYYRDIENNRPQMIADGAGAIAIQGGQLFDPNAPPPKAKGRSVSERPPGL